MLVESYPLPVWSVRCAEARSPQNSMHERSSSRT